MCELNLKISDKCIGCKKCIKDCIAGVLEFDEKNNIPKVRENGEKRCIKCQHCLAICPVGALSVFNKNPEVSEPIKAHNPDEILNLIKTRRSFRHYKNENVSKEILNKLKNMLNWSPTGINFHKLQFSFVEDIEVMDEIRNYTNKKIIKSLKNPIIRWMFKKYERYQKMILKGEDVIFRGAPHMVVVSTPNNAPCKEIDPVIALSYFELYAQSLGLGTCWCGLAHGIFKHLPEIQKQLEIPKGSKISYIMLFGLPSEKYHRAVQSEDFDFVSVKKQIKN